MFSTKERKRGKREEEREVNVVREVREGEGKREVEREVRKRERE